MNMVHVSRRNVVMGILGASSASVALGRAGSNDVPGYGLQLYPLQSLFQSDMPRLFDRIAKAGFRKVEFAGFASYGPSVVRAALTTAGLQASGAHCLPLALDEDAAARQLEFCQAAGIPHVLTALPCLRPDAQGRPAPPSAVFKGMSIEDVRWCADRMNMFGRLASRHGLRYGYHTHNVDFRPVGSAFILDYLMRWTDPAEVFLQLDIGNAIVAGSDPLHLLRTFRSRIRSVHLKDWAPGFSPSFGLEFPRPAGFGTGVVAWRPLLEALHDVRGAEVIIEQETAKGIDSFEAQVQALQYLRGI